MKEVTIKPQGLRSNWLLLENIMTTINPHTTGLSYHYHQQNVTIYDGIGRIRIDILKKKVVINFYLQ